MKTPLFVILVILFSGPMIAKADARKRVTNRSGEIKVCERSEFIQNHSNQLLSLWSIEGIEGTLVHLNKNLDVQEPKIRIFRSISDLGLTVKPQESVLMAKYFDEVNCPKLKNIYQVDWTYQDWLVVESEGKQRKKWIAGSEISDCDYTWEENIAVNGKSRWVFLTKSKSGVLSTNSSVLKLRTIVECRNAVRIVNTPNQKLEREMLTISNYPEPFNPSTKIQFKQNVSGQIRYQVFNSAGQSVKTHGSFNRQTGIHEISFQGDSLPSGKYFLRVHFRNEVFLHSMTLLK